jgi:hypothetical protein
MQALKFCHAISHGAEIIWLSVEFSTILKQRLLMPNMRKTKNIENAVLKQS